MRLAAVCLTLLSLNCSNCNRVERTADCRDPPAYGYCADRALSVLPAELKATIRFVEAVNYQYSVRCTLTKRGQLQACADSSDIQSRAEDLVTIKGGQELDDAIAHLVEKQRYKPEVTNGRTRIEVTSTLGHSAAFAAEVASAERVILTELFRLLGTTIPMRLCLYIGTDSSVAIPLDALPVLGPGGPPIASQEECRQEDEAFWRAADVRGYLIVHQVLWRQADAAKATGTAGISGVGGADYSFDLVRSNVGWSVKVTGVRDFIE
jgi:hypothetical protein